MITLWHVFTPRLPQVKSLHMVLCTIIMKGDSHATLGPHNPSLVLNLSHPWPSWDGSEASCGVYTTNSKGCTLWSRCKKYWIYVRWAVSLLTMIWEIWNVQIPWAVGMKLVWYWSWYDIYVMHTFVENLCNIREINSNWPDESCTLELSKKY